MPRKALTMKARRCCRGRWAGRRRRGGAWGGEDEDSSGLLGGSPAGWTSDLGPAPSGTLGCGPRLQLCVWGGTGAGVLGGTTFWRHSSSRTSVKS